jgi:hypothetical protein
MPATRTVMALPTICAVMVHSNLKFNFNLKHVHVHVGVMIVHNREHGHVNE